jgi:hypothetical protein
MKHAPQTKPAVPGVTKTTAPQPSATKPTPATRLPARPAVPPIDDEEHAELRVPAYPKPGTPPAIAPSHQVGGAVVEDRPPYPPSTHPPAIEPVDTDPEAGQAGPWPLDEEE